MIIGAACLFTVATAGTGSSGTFLIIGITVVTNAGSRTVTITIAHGPDRDVCTWMIRGWAILLTGLSVDWNNVNQENQTQGKSKWHSGDVRVSSFNKGAGPIGTNSDACTHTVLDSEFGVSGGNGLSFQG